MKKQPLMHPRVFDDEKWAIDYAKRHAKLGKRISIKYGKILPKRVFKEERILDIGCGSAAILMELSRTFHKAEAIRVDLSS